MKKKVIVIILVLLLSIVVFLLYQFPISRFINKISLENSIHIFEDKEELPFYINQTILYSNAYGQNQNANFRENNWLLNVYQYTDIALYIDTYLENFTEKNTIKKLYLSDFSFSKAPSVGEPSMYYLDAQQFGTEKYQEENRIDNTLEFTVLNDNNAENTIQTNTPVFFADLSNPITLKYVNQINQNFSLPSNEIIFFNGNLLKRADIALKDLETTLCFKINLVCNDNTVYYYTIHLPIPLQSQKDTLYTHYILEENHDLNYQFLK